MSALTYQSGRLLAEQAGWKVTPEGVQLGNGRTVSPKDATGIPLTLLATGHAPPSPTVRRQLADRWEAEVAEAAGLMKPPDEPNEDVPDEPAPTTLEALDAIERYRERFVIEAQHAAVAAALFDLFTHIGAAAWVVPYLYRRSPEMESGKSLGCEVDARLVHAPLWTGGATEGLISRAYLNGMRTLICDEIGLHLGRRDDKSQAVTAAINMGTRRESGFREVLVPSEDGGWTSQQMPLFGPKILAGNRHEGLPDTVIARSIVIEMQRAPWQDTQALDRFNGRAAREEGVTLQRRLAAWGAVDEHKQLVEDPDPPLPDTLTSSRAREKWAPLVALADHAGGQWPARAREAAAALTASEQANDEPNHGNLVLRAAQGWFEEHPDASFLANATLAAVLSADPDLPFATWRPDGITADRVGRFLRSYNIPKMRPRAGTWERGIEDQHLPERPYGVWRQDVLAAAERYAQ